MKSVYIIIAIFALCSSSQLVSAECQDKGLKSICNRATTNPIFCDEQAHINYCKKSCGACDDENNPLASAECQDVTPAVCLLTTAQPSLCSTYKLLQEIVRSVR